MKNSNKKQPLVTNKALFTEQSWQQGLRHFGVADVPFMAKDFDRLQKLMQRCHQRHKQSDVKEQTLDQLKEVLNRSNLTYQKRLSTCPQPTYASVLPITAKVTEIREAIVSHPVVVVAGDTGSGKSTQLPKICLQAGRGISGYIGHTQPRRIAARSIAERISEELQTELGSTVGYKVRFSDQTRTESLIKLMTDGILLAELQRDRYLSAYDTIIIDEAHERSLNIDFLMGYLTSLVDIRSDLKVIITSATIDTEKFARHFGDAPIISVEGRTYPVEVRYAEIKKDDKDDVSSVVRHTVESIIKTQEKGDILVFLSGEAEIKRCMDVITKRKIANTLVLPLYSRLAYKSQHAIFQPSPQRKIILATNIAETSLTIPGIKYVIDPGYARMSRYNFRRKVQRLPIEKISQASANQRKGRCGRVSNGVCYRLYSQDDFEQRPEFTDPEIKRTNLAAVILQLEASRLGDVRTFPFIDPPDYQFINDGYKLLFELAAVDESHKLTRVGRQLARYPVDPRLARMLMAAGQENCLYEIVIIVSALSIQDIRETSFDKAQQAQLAHQLYSDKLSDFLFYLNVWEVIKTFKTGDLRRFCKQNYFSFLRMIEWRDIVRQLNSVIKEMKVVTRPRNEPASYNQIHRAILPGLISLVGLKNDDGSYKAPHNSNFLISHRSCLHKKPTRWIMAESLVHTRKLFASNVAKIYPKWIEQMAAHLIKKSYYDIEWDDKRGRVVAYENTELYGLTIQARRRIDYGKQDAIASRPVFIQKALVERQLTSSLEFLKHNNSLLQRLETLEAKFRTRNIVINDTRLFELYQQIIPETVCSEETLTMWLKSDPQHSEQLKFHEQDVCEADLASLDLVSYPDHLRLLGTSGEHKLAMHYVFEPGREDDGISVEVPIFLLPKLQEQDLDCLVPGLLKEKLVAMIKTLPKSLRTSFIPATNTAEKCLPYIVPGKTSLQEQFAQVLRQLTGKTITAENWCLEKLPDYLRMNIKIRNAAGQLMQSGRELSLLKFLLDTDITQAQAETPKNKLERDGIRHWDFTELPRKIQVNINNFTLEKYPAIVDQSESVSIKLCSDANHAERMSRAGLRRLFILSQAKKVKYMRRNIPDIEKMALLYTSLGSGKELQQLLETLIIDTAFYDGITAAEIRNKEQFDRQAQSAEKSLLLVMNDIGQLVHNILDQRRIIRKKLEQSDIKSDIIKTDLLSQLDRLFADSFIINTPLTWLQRYPVYLSAILKRLDNFKKSPAADEERQRQVEKYQTQYTKLHDDARETVTSQASKLLVRYRWMLEEFRLSLFAQGMRTIEPVSGQRLDRLLHEINKELK